MSHLSSRIWTTGIILWDLMGNTRRGARKQANYPSQATSPTYSQALWWVKLLGTSLSSSGLAQLSAPGWSRDLCGDVIRERPGRLTRVRPWRAPEVAPWAQTCQLKAREMKEEGFGKQPAARRDESQAQAVFGGLQMGGGGI